MRQGALLVTAPEYVLPWAGLTRSPTAVLESVSTTCGVTRQKSDNQEGELWEAEMPVQTGQRSWGRGGLEHTGQDAPRQHCGLSTSLWFRPQWTCFPRRRHGVLRRIGFPT